jgi:hypothetical protein
MFADVVKLFVSSAELVHKMYRMQHYRFFLTVVHISRMSSLYFGSQLDTLQIGTTVKIQKTVTSISKEPI